ncbi:MAG: type II toxin-antitoxin system HicA family toxin [Clostridiales bacterium]|nr:type II toxin-antitoxin system HicA family toxin [Clostridiales bacterium]
MKSYSSREVIRILKADGWYEVSCVGDHHQFRHPSKPGKVTVVHPEKDIPLGALKSIAKQAGVMFP